MNKIIFALLIFLSNFFYAQNYRVVYQLKFKTDSLKENHETQNMVLDITPTESKFYFARLLKFDSLSKKGIKLNVSFPLQQILKKQKGSNKFTNYHSVDGQYFQYITDDFMKWEIEKEVRSSDFGKLQKAKTTFGGRIWEAWFSYDNPIQEGPYKFSGLPGLIVEIKDTRNNFMYRMVSFTKQETVYDTSNVVETSLGLKPIVVSEKKFQEILLSKYLNPFSEFDNLSDGSWGLQFGERHITTKKELLEIKREQQKQIQTNYNPMELNKAIKYQ